MSENTQIQIFSKTNLLNLASLIDLHQLDLLV